MKVIFHPRFYEVYTSDPSAAPGTMVRALEKEFEFVEPGPAFKGIWRESMERVIFNPSEENLRFMKWESSPQAALSWQQRWLSKANLLSS